MSNPSSSPKNQIAGAPGPRRGRRLIYGLLGLSAALALVAALAPSILSTPVGRNLVVGAINDAVLGSVRIDALSLSWFGRQSIRGVEILDPAGTKVGRLEELSTELSLFEAIRRKLSLGQTLIRGLSADLLVDDSGSNNLARALEPRRSRTRGAAPLAIPFTGNIELVDAHMTVKTSHTEPVLFDGLAGAMQIDPAGRLLNVALEGRSLQGNKAGKFQIRGQISGLIAPDGALSLKTAKGNLQADVEDLPIDSIDGMLGLNGLLSAAAGDAASLRIQASGTAEVQDLVITADSPNIQAEVTAQLTPDRFVLTRPASVRLNVTPDLFQALTQANQDGAALRLAEPFQLSLNAERLELFTPLPSPAAAVLHGGVEVSRPVRLAAPELGEITVRSLHARIDTERLAESVIIELDGEVASQGEPGKLAARAKLDQLVNEVGAVQLDRMRADVAVDLSNIPTLLIDQIAGQNGRLLELLGPKIGLTAKTVSSGSDRIDATLTLDAGPLKAAEVSLSLADSLVLTRPAQVHYLLSPQAARRLLGEDQGFALRQPVGLVIEVQAFSAPRPGAGERFFQPDRTKIQGTLTSERLALSGIPSLDTLQVDGARLDLNADSLAAIRLRGSAEVSEAGDGILKQLGASPLEVLIDAAAQLDETGATGPIDTQLKLNGKGVSADISLRMPPDLSRAALSAPGAVRFSLTPGLLRRLGAASPDGPTLGKPASIDIGLSRLELPLAGFSWASLQAEGTLRAAELVLAGEEALAGVSLRNTDMAIDYDGPKGSAAVKLAAVTAPSAANQQSGSLRVDATMGRLLRDGRLSPSAADIDAEADIEALPTVVLAALSGQAALAPIIGDIININASVKIAGDKDGGAVELKADSRNLNADAGFKLGDELVLSRPANARLTLTPAGYEALVGASSTSTDQAAAGYVLAEDATFESLITTLRWPLAAQFDSSRAALAATAKTPRLSLRERASGQTISIENFEMRLEGPDLSKPIDIEINGEIRDAQKQKAQPGDAAGRIGVSGRAADALTPDGRFNSKDLSLRLDGKLQRLPTALLDDLLDGEGMLAATLGDATDVDVNANLQRMAGPLDMKLQSTNATAVIKTQLTQAGLTLTEPLVAEVKVTQAFGKLVLGKIHPIFETAQSSERAVTLEIPREGTLIPIRDYDVSRIVIPRMVLDLGKLTLKSGWLLKGAVGLAQQFGALESSGRDQWSAQFTPAVLSMSGGKAVYERRVDLLLDERMHLATWGTADIANDRVDLVLAFMPETLEKVFGLRVAPGDALRVPLRGALSGPSVDFGRAGLEIERLRQQQRLAKKDPLVGALVGAVATTAIGGGPIPPPSVTPLPWGALPEAAGTVEAQPAKKSTQPSQPAPKSVEQQAIEGLIGILRKKKE